MSGGAPGPALELELVSAAEAGGHLFLRYRAPSAE